MLLLFFSEIKSCEWDDGGLAGTRFLKMSDLGFIFPPKSGVEIFFAFLKWLSRIQSCNVEIESFFYTLSTKPLTGIYQIFQFRSNFLSLRKPLYLCRLRECRNIDSILLICVVIRSLVRYSIFISFVSFFSKLFKFKKRLPDFVRLLIQLLNEPAQD